MHLEFDKEEGARISIELQVGFYNSIRAWGCVSYCEYSTIADFPALFSIFVTFDICPETQQAVHGGCVSFCEYTQQWKEKWKV